VEQNGPVNLFRFVINPNDFAQSVENLFYLSFLIRDGECALEIEDDGEPVICAFLIFVARTSDCCNVTFHAPSLVICEQPQPSDYQEGLRKQQLVFEFDVKTWEVGDPFVQMNRSSVYGTIRKR
jgi:non-structural maintenance of chromosomes element 4